MTTVRRTRTAKTGNTVETRPGIKTTEFWVTVVVLLFSALDALGAYDAVPDRWDGLLAGLAAVGYAVSRGLAKFGVPNNPQPPTT